MGCLTLLFIGILTVVSKVTSLHCSQLPSSGDDHLQQVTTLQYCLVDDCTIMKIDTGDKLDIVYTTDSLIVTTPTDGHTSEMIARLENELPCLTPDGKFDNYQLQDAVEIVEFFLTLVVSGFIIVIHVMFKELQNLLGKLLILYNIAVMGMCIFYIGLLLTSLQPLLDTLAFCYICTIGMIISVVSLEALVTCILSQIATTMHHTYKMQSQMSKETLQRYFRFYKIYTLGVMLLVVLLTICYDVATGNYKDVLLLNGQCVSFDVNIYNTFQIAVMVDTIQKIIQLVRFITYLYYVYKLNKDINDAGISSNQQSHLHKLVVAMASFIGLSSLAFIFLTMLDLAMVVIPFTQALFLIQQCVIAAIFLCSKKVHRLLRDCLFKD